MAVLRMVGIGPECALATTVITDRILGKLNSLCALAPTLAVNLVTSC